MRRDNVASTSIWCHFGIMCLLVVVVILINKFKSVILVQILIPIAVWGLIPFRFAKCWVSLTCIWCTGKSFSHLIMHIWFCSLHTILMCYGKQETTWAACKYGYTKAETKHHKHHNYHQFSQHKYAICKNANSVKPLVHKNTLFIRL